MKEYINKSAVVAEIESKKNRAQILGDNAINGSMQQFYDGMKQGCVDILSFLDTLEVKDDMDTIHPIEDVVLNDTLSNDLEEAARKHPSAIRIVSPQWETEVESAFIAGAKWQKEQLKDKGG